jgi:membrane-bound lytic murein transglycosylase B
LPGDRERIGRGFGEAAPYSTSMAISGLGRQGGVIVKRRGFQRSRRDAAGGKACAFGSFSCWFGAGQGCRKPMNQGVDTMFSRSLFAAALLAVAGSLPVSAVANEMDFATWLAGVRQEALSLGIAPATVAATLTDLHPIPRVLELDRRQPERILTFDEYLSRTVTTQRVEAARSRLAQNRALLDEIGKRYGVQPRFIVALWGIESDFGRAMGNFPIIPALATLAYDGRRSKFFRGELMNALRIVDRGEARPEEMTGSWAGAMGQSQFMPSSYLAYAVDYTGDGRRDIWHRPADVFASIANYLSRSGWHGDQGWGRPISLPSTLDSSLIGVGTRLPLARWSELGVRRGDGGELPREDMTASIVEPGGPGGPVFLIYDNYRTVLKWNNSLFFATAVGYLADRIE